MQKVTENQTAPGALTELTRDLTEKSETYSAAAAEEEKEGRKA